MRAGSYHASPGGQEFRQVCTRLADDRSKYCRLALTPGQGVEETRCGGAGVAGTGAVNSEGRHDRKEPMEFISNQIAMYGQPMGAATGGHPSGKRACRAIPAPAGRRRRQPARLASSMASLWPGGRRPASPHARSSAVCMPMCPGNTNGDRGTHCRHRAPCCWLTGEYRTASTIGSRPVLYQAWPDGVDQS